MKLRMDTWTVGFYESSYEFQIKVRSSNSDEIFLAVPPMKRRTETTIHLTRTSIQNEQNLPKANLNMFVNLKHWSFATATNDQGELLLTLEHNEVFNHEIIVHQSTEPCAIWRATLNLYSG